MQLAGTDARRDHYIPLADRGWTYVVLDPPEDDRFFDYTWPYSFTDLMYTCYRRVPEREAVPSVLQRSAARGEGGLLDRADRGARRAAAAAGVAGPGGGRPEARLSRLAQARRVPGNGLGRPARHFDPNGALLGQVTPQGALRLAPGENRVRFSSTLGDAASPRAEVTLSVRGQPLVRLQGRSN